MVSSILTSSDLGAISEKISWAFAAVATLAFGLRVFCRLRYTSRQGGGLYIDDFITLAALLALLIFCILLSFAVRSGLGRHYNTLSAVNKTESLRWNAITLAVTPWICTLPKFAIITTLQRILNYSQRTNAIFWALAILSQLSVVGLMFWGLFQCTPVSFQWDKSIQGGTCADPLIYIRFAYVVYIYSTILDVFFALYPVPSIMRLRLPLSARLGVAIPLSLSWFGVAISVYKFALIPQVGSLVAKDPSYPFVYLTMTHAAEGSFLIISTSLATLRPLLRGIKQRVTDRSLISKRHTKISNDSSGTGGEEGSQTLRSPVQSSGDKRHTFEQILMDETTSRSIEENGGEHVVYGDKFPFPVERIEKSESATEVKVVAKYTV